MAEFLRRKDVPRRGTLLQARLEILSSSAEHLPAFLRIKVQRVSMTSPKGDRVSIDSLLMLMLMTSRTELRGRARRVELNLGIYELFILKN